MSTPDGEIVTETEAVYGTRVWVQSDRTEETEVPDQDLVTNAGARWFNGVNKALRAINSFFNGGLVPTLIKAARIAASGGQGLVAGDIVLNGWGAGASVSTVKAGSNGQRFRIIITAGTGPSANPTAVVTFPGGAHPAGAIAQCRMNGGTGTTQNLVWTQPDAATMTITYSGTPVNGSTYAFDCLILG